jgi:2-polyprenyl-3-methyl-5-hydroxy-6-metoxy-1,4-benzoquinol methylase
MSAKVAEDPGTGMVVETRYGLGVSSAASIDDFAIEKRKGQILEYIPLEGKTMLDIGCGNGLYILALASLAKKTVGIDIRHEVLTEATKNKVKLGRDTEFIRAAAESLPLCDSTFDVVLLVEMLEHVRSEGRVLEETNRVLKNEGYLLIYVPNKLYPFEEHGLRIRQRNFEGLYGGSIPFFSWCPQVVRNKFERARIYTKGQIVRLVEKYGLTVQDVDYMYPPLDRLGSELTKGVLRKIMSVLEHNRLLKRFGMSIFIVAQKRN